MRSYWPTRWDCSLGKTVQALGILNCLQWQKALVICPASLRINWQREADKWLVKKPSIGIVLDGKTYPEGDLIICNYELLGKHPRLRETNWDIIVADECFPAGTEVLTPLGWKNIELIQAGDSIISAAGIDIIENTFSKRSHVVSIETTDGFIECTETHPFFTNCGWVFACNLNEQHILISYDQVMRMVQASTHSELWCQILREILLSEMANESAIHQSGNQSETTTREMEPYNEKDDEGQSSRRQNVFRTNEDQQSYGSRRNKGSYGSEVTGNWSQAYSKGRKWTWTNEGGANTHGGVSPSSMEHSHQHEQASWVRLSDCIQGRFRDSGAWPASGGGWKFTRSIISETAGLEKRRIFSDTRIQSSQGEKFCRVLRRGDTHSSAISVFNLHVKNHPSYFVRIGNTAVLVHNCHAIKGKSQRTKNTLSLRSDRWVFLTGTPIMNRPAEIWNIAHKCAPKVFPNWWGFAKRYCDMKETPFGLDTRGASNLGELNQKLSTFMIRRRKEDVLKDLPPKRRQIIELPPTKEMRVVLDRENMQWKVHEETMAKLVARRDQAALLNDEQEYRSAANELKQAYKVAFAEMAKVRQEVALAKLPLCIAHIKDLLESVDKIIVFCRHKAVAANLMEELKEYRAVVLMGDTAMQERQKAVDAMQNDPACRVFVGSIQAAGVGITLTASSTVVFVEPDWTPALLSQCEDRSWRYGQKNSVLVQHLVLESSLDSHMLKQVMAKQEIIDQAIDAAGGNPEEAKKKVKVSYAIDGARYNRDQRTLLIKCLRAIADKDKDGARQRNGEGFSIYHSQIGKQLAGKWELSDAEAGFAAMLVKRYRNQIDAGMVKLTGVI